jgi:hypothetical protein
VADLRALASDALRRLASVRPRYTQREMQPHRARHSRRQMCGPRAFASWNGSAPQVAAPHSLPESLHVNDDFDVIVVGWGWREAPRPSPWRSGRARAGSGRRRSFRAARCAASSFR